MNAPDYAFEAIIEWARGTNNDNYSFHPQGGLSRSNNVDVLFSSMHNAKKLLPNVQIVHVPHGPPCDVIAPFTPELQDNDAGNVGQSHKRSPATISKSRWNTW